MPQTFSALFLAALAATTLIRLWVGLRHIRHIAAHRAQVPAAFADAITLEAHQRAAHYATAKMRIGLLDILVSALVLLGFTIGGGLNALFNLAGQFTPVDSHANGILFIGLVILTSWLLELPFSLYRTFGIEARFGFNKTTPRLYLTDTLKTTLLSVAIGAPVLLVVLWLMDSMGTHWWLYVWLFWAGFNLLVLLIYPSYIAPLFNKFSPLTDDGLKTRIEALLSRCGFQSSGLFVMDGSRRSAHGNAYFTGFGRTKRIVFFDTLLERLTPKEIEAVLAHELGHYHHRHIWKRIAMTFAGSLILLWLLAQLMSQPWFYSGLGLHAQGVAPALILFMMVMPVFLFPLSPLMSLLSRRHEFQADAFAARMSNADDLVSALVKLYRDNASTLTPDPLYSALHDSHPPAAIRIAHLKTGAAA